MIKFRRMITCGGGERWSRLGKAHKGLKQNWRQIWPKLLTKLGGWYVGIHYIALYDSFYVQSSMIEVMWNFSIYTT